MSEFLFDTTVFVYATGREHPYRSACRTIVARAGRGEGSGAASVQVIHELAHLTLRRTGDRDSARARAQAAAAVCRRVHECDRHDLEVALDLLVSHGRLTLADAITAATALNRGIDSVLSADRDFDGIPGLKRIDPVDTRAVAALLG